MSVKRSIQRALISVYDKTGLIDLARGLHDAGVEIVSTGSTAKTIADKGIPVTPVEFVTGFPEILDGRVKTLHPRIHGGILADSRNPEHLKALQRHDIAPFDLVVVNLYPFSETVASGAELEECVEQIDIGGPAMVRAAAKNHATVAVVVDPMGYDGVLAAVRGGGFTLEERRKLAALAFRHTAEYDVAVATWMGEQFSGEDPEALPAWFGATWQRQAVLRYGENPHQKAALYVDRSAWPGLPRPSSCTARRCPTTTTPTPTPRGGPRSTTRRSAWRSSSTPTRAASRSRRRRWPTPTARRTPATRCRRSAG